MSAEPGGIAAKLGSLYERRYALEQLLRLIAGRLTRLRWEPASGDRDGSDIEVEHPDGVVEHIQLKRQRRSDVEWTVAALDAEGVLNAIAKVTASSPTSRFTFVSSYPVHHLKDICDQLQHNSDAAAEFIAKQVRRNSKRSVAFEELLKRWGYSVGDPLHESEAIDRLRRLEFVVRDRGRHAEQDTLNQIGAALTGEPAVSLALLSQFLDDHIGKHLLSQDVLEHLSHHHIRPRDLDRDPTIHTVLQSLRTEFRDHLRERLVAGTMIVRPEVETILNLLTGPNPPRVILVHGKPGYGKSSVLLGVAEALIDRGVPFLPLSLSLKPPNGSPLQYGDSLGLKAAPPAALTASAQGRRAVLLVDQLDAMRTTTNESVRMWDVCAQILGQAIREPNTTLLVACRTFDLENDQNILRWKDSLESKSGSNGLVTVEVGDLSPHDLAPVLRAVGVEYASLPVTLQTLLRHPATLDAYHRLAQRGTPRRDFKTQTQLLAALLTQLVSDASRTHSISSRDVHHVLDQARLQMEQHGWLSLPQTLLDGDIRALEACCAAGLFVRHGVTISFPHQSYFDHLVAKAALKESGYSSPEIVEWTKSNQSLERRDQLRQLLFTLRDEDTPLFATVAEELLRDANVRFHLKQLVLGVLRESDSPTQEEVRLVAELAADAHWAHHVNNRILWNSVAWFDAMHSNGSWPRLLQRVPGEDTPNWLHTVLAMSSDRADAVDSLLTPVLKHSEALSRLERSLPFDPESDTPKIAAIRDEQIRRGHWAVHDLSLARVAKRDPVRAVRLTTSVIRGTLRRTLGLLSADAEEEVSNLREEAFEKDVAQAVRTLGRASFPALSRLLRVIDRLHERAYRALVGDHGHDQRSFRYRAILSDLREVLAPLTGHAFVGITDSSPQSISALLNSPAVHRSRALSTAIAGGLAQSSAAVSDVAIGWLCADPARLALCPDWTERDEYGLAADIIRNHAATCSPEALCSLESVLLRLHPEKEKRHYKYLLKEVFADGHWYFSEGGQRKPIVNPIGRAQHLLLSAIPESRRSPPVQARLAMWDVKFGGTAVERPGATSSGGWVGSPIPQHAIPRIPDRQWLDIISRKWPDRRIRQIGPDRLAESSHSHFANDMAQVAKAQKDRFVRLALRFPNGTPPVYLTRIFDALADRGTSLDACDPREVDALMAVAAGSDDRDLLKSACRTIEAHAQFAWGDAAWLALAQAASHEDPRADEHTVHSTRGGRLQPDIELTSINCVRGVAASALGVLAWDNSGHAERALALVDRLARDPHPAVRMEAAHASLGIYTVDKERGVELLRVVADHPDDRVLASPWMSRLIRYARWSHPDTFHSIFQRMIDSLDPRVAEQGAVWVAAEHFQRGACADAYAACRDGSERQRIGVAKLLGDLICEAGVDHLEIETAMATLMNDDSDEVRSSAANAVRRKESLCSESGPAIAAAFVASTAFAEHADDLLWPLAHEPVDLLVLSKSILAMAERFATDLADQTRSFRNRLGMAGRDLSVVLLKLYDAARKANDDALANACLDRWDGLLAAGVGGSDAKLD